MFTTCKFRYYSSKPTFKVDEHLRGADIHSTCYATDTKCIHRVSTGPRSTAQVGLRGERTPDFRGAHAGLHRWRRRRRHGAERWPDATGRRQSPAVRAAFAKQRYASGHSATFVKFIITLHIFAWSADHVRVCLNLKRMFFLLCRLANIFRKIIQHVNKLKIKFYSLKMFFCDNLTLLVR